MDFPQVPNQGFDFKIGELIFAPSYIQAGAVVLLIFILILTLARLRRMYVNWSFAAAGSMLLIGFMLTLVLEGFLILSGRTLLTEILGWENAPKPLQNVLISGRTKFVEVMGVTDEIPASYAEDEPDLDDVVTRFQSLSPSDAREFRSLICEP